MNCPKCNSDEINAYMLVHGFAWVDVKNTRIDEGPDDCDFDYEDIANAMEFSCNNCLNRWED